MVVTREELAAWADGQISGIRREEISAVVKGDPQLQREVAVHRALKTKLGAHFAPLLDEPVPDHLAAMLEPEKVVDFAKAREQRSRSPRWGWIAGSALAASLALAMFVPRSGEDVVGNYAGAQLAQALDTQLAATQGDDEQTRILLSFRNEGGEFCRAYGSSEASGIACRDGAGWRFAAVDEGIGGEGAAQAGGEFRQAGSDVSVLMQQAQDMAAGPALNARQEAAAREEGWR